MGKEREEDSAKSLECNQMDGSNAGTIKCDDDGKKTNLWREREESRERRKLAWSKCPINKPGLHIGTSYRVRGKKASVQLPPPPWLFTYIIIVPVAI